MEPLGFGPVLGKRSPNYYEEIDGFLFPVFTAEFSPDGQQILTAHGDTYARIWSSAGELITTFQGHTNWLSGASFSPNGEHVVTNSTDRTARIWSQSGETLAILQGHADWVTTAKFSPDGSQIVTASLDGTARLWSANGTLRAVYGEINNPVLVTAFNPDGTRLVTGQADGTLKLWLMYTTVETALESAQKRLSRGFSEIECNRYFPNELEQCPQITADVFAPFAP